MDRKLYKMEWEREPLLAPWLSQCKDGSGFAFCKACNCKLQCRLDSLRSHAYSNKHAGNTSGTDQRSASKFVFIKTGQKNYSVSWGSFQKIMCQGLSGLQQNKEFVDMTIAADGHLVQVHQMVLSLISPYIKELIKSAACPHPVIYLSKISNDTLQAILQYAYTGEVVVSNDNIQEFLLACKELHIRGLEQNSEETLIEDRDKDFTNEDNDNENLNNSSTTYNLPSCDQETDMEDVGDDYANDDLDIDASIESQVITQPPIQSIKPKTSIIRDITDVSFKYTVSNQGKPQIVLNRYVYNFRHPRKNGESYWRCCKYSKPGITCRAGLIVKDKKIIRRAHSHNHPFDDAKILKKLQRRNIFETRTEVELVNDKSETEIAETNQPSSPSETILISHGDEYTISMPTL